MKYDIYFHNDFDGRASAAVVLAFLRNRGDEIIHYTPVDFDIADQWMDERFFKKHKLFKGERHPAIVVDFLYHPGAAIWFDHHPTSIKKESWKKSFCPDKHHRLEPHYPSCCHATYASLKKDFKWKPPAHLKELVKWLDVIDGARYRSARQTLEVREPALQVDSFIELDYKDEKTTIWLIDLLSRRPLREIARIPKIARVAARYRREVARSLRYYHKHFEVSGRVGFIDLMKASVMRLLYAPYYLNPKILYELRATPRGPLYHVHVGSNPWRQKENKIHIGRLLRERYGGGGHMAVGGVEFTSRAKMDRAVREIIDFLNSPHA